MDLKQYYQHHSPDRKPDKQKSSNLTRAGVSRKEMQTHWILVLHPLLSWPEQGLHSGHFHSDTFAAKTFSSTAPKRLIFSERLHFHLACLFLCVTSGTGNWRMYDRNSGYSQPLCWLITTISRKQTENQTAGLQYSIQLNTAFSSCFATDCLPDALLSEGNPLTASICSTCLLDTMKCIPSSIGHIEVMSGTLKTSTNNHSGSSKGSSCQVTQF